MHLVISEGIQLATVTVKIMAINNHVTDVDEQDTGLEEMSIKLARRCKSTFCAGHETTVCDIHAPPMNISNFDTVNIFQNTCCFFTVKISILQYTMLHLTFWFITMNLLSVLSHSFFFRSITFCTLFSMKSRSADTSFSLSSADL